MCARSEMWFSGEKRLVNAFTHSAHVMGDRFFVSAFCDGTVASCSSAIHSSVSESRCCRLPAAGLCAKRGRYRIARRPITSSDDPSKECKRACDRMFCTISCSSSVGAPVRYREAGMSDTFIIEVDSSVRGEMDYS